MPRIAPRFASLLLLMSAVAGSPAARAETLMVSAVIRPKAVLQLQDAPRELHISAQDVRQGFVDAAAPLALTVRSIGNRDLVLHVAVRNEHVRQFRMEGLGAPVELAPAGGTALLTSGGSRTLALRFRFYLAPGTPAGTYPWPVQLDAAA